MDKKTYYSLYSRAHNNAFDAQYYARVYFLALVGRERKLLPFATKHEHKPPDTHRGKQSIMITARYYRNDLFPDFIDKSMFSVNSPRPKTF